VRNDVAGEGETLPRLQGGTRSSPCSLCCERMTWRATQGSSAHYWGVRCPGAHYRGFRNPSQGSQVPITGGSGAHHMGVRCPSQGGAKPYPGLWNTYPLYTSCEMPSSPACAVPAPAAAPGRESKV